MKVILTENIATLGQPGEVKDVANGYARNYLLPRGMAVPATAGALKQLERQQAMIGKKAAAALEQARGLADRLNTTEVVVYGKSGEQSRLYGSVTNADVAKALQEQHDLTIDRRNISLDEPIHRLGSYHATVKLSNGQSGKLTVIVDNEENRGKPRPEAQVAPAVEVSGESAAMSTDVTGEAADMTAPMSSTAAELPVTVVELPATDVSGEAADLTAPTMGATPVTEPDQQ